MGETTKKSRVKTWFKDLKAEFKKIVWPDTKSLSKQTAVVLVIAICLGAVIAVLDMILQYGINFLIK